MSRAKRAWMRFCAMRSVVAPHWKSASAFGPKTTRRPRAPSATSTADGGTTSSSCSWKPASCSRWRQRARNCCIGPTWAPRGAAPGSPASDSIGPWLSSSRSRWCPPSGARESRITNPWHQCCGLPNHRNGNLSERFQPLRTRLVLGVEALEPAACALLALVRTEPEEANGVFEHDLFDLGVGATGLVQELHNDLRIGLLAVKSLLASDHGPIGSIQQMIRSVRKRDSKRDEIVQGRATRVRVAKDLAEVGEIRISVTVRRALEDLTDGPLPGIAQVRGISLLEETAEMRHAEPQPRMLAQHRRPKLGVGPLAVAGTRGVRIGRVREHGNVVLAAPRIEPIEDLIKL